jgi:PAS domain S-box-containing protein
MKRNVTDGLNPVDRGSSNEVKQDITLSLSRAAIQAIEAEAQKQGISVSNLVERLAQGFEQTVEQQAPRLDTDGTAASQFAPSESQQRLEEFQTLFEVLPICVGIAQDAECREIRINPAFSNLLGGSFTTYPADESVNPPFRIFQYGQELLTHQLPLQYAAQQQAEVRDAEIDIVREDGTVSNLYGYAMPLLNEQGKVRGAVSAFWDVTALRQTEAELRRSETRFRRLVETSVFGVAIGDFSGKISYANNAFLNMIGYTQAELSRLNWIDLTPPELRSTDQSLAAMLVQHGSIAPFEKEYIHKQGHRVPILIGAALLDEPLVSVNAFQNEVSQEADNSSLDASQIASDQLQEVVVFCIDLTRLKQAEATLREQEERFRFLAESIPHFVWTANSDGSGEYYNRRCLNYLGTTAEQMRVSIWTQFVHPDDIAQAVTVWTNALTQKAEGQVEIRIRRADGEYRWFESRMVPFWDNHNQAVRWFATCTDIDDRKRAEQALRRSEEQFRLLIEHAPDAIFISDQQGVYLDVNASACQLLGYERDALIGKQTTDLIPAEDLPRFITAKEQLLAGQSQVEEWTLIHKNGTLIPVEVSAKILSDGRWQAFIRNISDRKQTEVALRQSELRFRTLADTMPQLFWTTQPDGYHTYFNQRWYEYTGMTLEQTQGWGWSQILHPSDRQRCFEVWNESLHTGKDYNIEYRLRSVNGEYRWFLARAFPLQAENGQILHWFGSCTDIHDQKMALEERDRAFIQEQIAREQAETANRIKDEFLAILSHELRSPLNPILGWTKLLRSRKFDHSTTDRALETIERNAKLQTQLIEDLLDISRILRGKMALDAVPVDLVNVIEAALETVDLAAEAKKIQIETQLERSIGQVSGDPNRLQQIVWNLLSNAVKFTPEGGRVEVTLTKVGNDLTGMPSGMDVGAVDGQNEPQTAVQLRVKDNGKGINPNFLPYVFDSFRQEDGKTTRGFGGLGLGLAIVRHLVELHGGRVIAESAGENQGATFTVTLPLLADSDPAIPQILPVPSSQPISLEGWRVLVVDDETDMQQLALVILQQAGATVQVANSAAEALEKMESFQPNLLISDLGMPEVDGYMLLRQIRQRYPASQQIPAIAVSAYATEYDRRKAIEAGFQRHLAKPIEPQDLVATVQEMLFLQQ